MSQILITAENFECLERLLATYAARRDRDALMALELAMDSGGSYPGPPAAATDAAAPTVR